MPTSTSASSSERIVIVGGGAAWSWRPSWAASMAANASRWSTADPSISGNPRCTKPRRALDIHQEGLSYLMLAHMNGFSFAQGRLVSVDRERRLITVDAVADPQGQEVLPRRELGYDTLVLALGSASNFFNTPGAARTHASGLDRRMPNSSA